MVICIPSGITEVEMRAVKESAERVNGKEVYLIHEPMAAAIGIGVDIMQPKGNMIVDIGAGTTKLSHVDPEGALHSRQQLLLNEIVGTCSPLPATMRPPHVSAACWDFLGKLLQPDAEKRLTAMQASQHVWLREPVQPHGPQSSSRVFSAEHCKSSGTPQTTTPFSSSRTSFASLPSACTSRSSSWDNVYERRPSL